MKITKIHYTSRFIRDFKNLSPSKQRKAIEKEELFKENSYTPELKTHKLTGSLNGY